MKAVVTDSLRSLRSHELPSGWDEFSMTRPCTPLGEMGATQEYLYYVVRMTKPRIVLETGVYRGVSSALILGALEDNGCGKLVSIDLPNVRYVDPTTGGVDSSPLQSGENTGFAIPESLRARWDLRLGDTRRILPDTLRELGQIDFFYHDSEHTYETMKWEYCTVLPHLTLNGTIASDDVGWNSAFEEFVAKNAFMWHGTIAGRLGVATNSPVSLP